MAPAPSSSNAATTSVQVALRIRPTTTQDTSSIPARFQRSVITAVSPTTVSVEATASTGPSAAAPAPAAGAGKKQVFTFDQVHPPATTQHAMFTSTAQPLISRFVDGFNCTILAYGQTSSGKTFTMTGVDLDADPADPSNGMGIIPRAVSTIFARCRDLKQERGDAWSYSLKGSFIEIYNEDLIDLLNVEAGKRDVQIREDKQGHILWEGLREVNVKGAPEVMNLIRQGTAIRRTNETDMNAQSSRSHAIFSLTLTQKKYSGSKPPPARSSSPLPPGGRPQSRIARPGSAFIGTPQVRVSSPTFSRPGTPSFQSAIGRGARPASSLGFLSPDGSRTSNGGSPADDGEGEWVTVVSKFHFVDLAGSERLKRTAAAGERIKEGISINSGLLALGNVISALGDPARAKSHTASYVPYRDSKLTRLLQDSLGGNAHTLMIACVSPTEWNVGETTNTLKYANRARNIKNRVVVNEKEEGWDDLEWLQGTVGRLRKELKALKEGGAVARTGSQDAPEATGKVLAQMAELQSNYEDIRAKFSERTEELTRLRRELAEKQRTSKGGHIGGTAKYEEIVGPVIEEYEKTISAMEAELNLNRAALRHTNDLYEEKEAEYAELSERHATVELYIEELKSRVAKLSEREASNEAYIRDLEEKIKQYDETSVSSSGSITDLKREISKYRDSDTYNSQYIADLEARLARSDESVLVLRESVEKLERDCERRREEAEVLQTRLDDLTRDRESWQTDLEERERKVRDLELKMAEWEAKKHEVAEDRERMGALVSEVAKARKSLEAAAPVTKLNGASTDSLATTLTETDNSMESQFIALQQAHAATLADLADLTAKYTSTVSELHDLNQQLQEAKVNTPIASSDSPERPADLSPRRRMTRGMSKDGLEPQASGVVRRPFFRQAVSTESLHSRSVSQSVSLSQELSSARSRNASVSSHGTSSSLSLSRSHSRPNLSISLPFVNVPSNERSTASLEKEIMRLQEVLQEREAEITALEQSLKEKDRATALANLIQSPSADSPVTPINGSGNGNGNGNLTVDPSLNLSPKTMARFKQLRHSLHIQVTQDGLSAPDADESLERLNELMRSMAQKESSHRETVDSLNTELAQVRRQFEELTVLSRDQTLNMATEIEALQKKHEEDLARNSEDLESLQQLEQRTAELTQSLAEVEHREADLAESLVKVQRRETELLESLERAEAEHAFEVAKLKSEHEEAMLAKGSEVDVLVERMKEDHEGALTGLRDQLTEAQATLEKARMDHEAAFGKLQAGHEEELKRRGQEVDDLLEHTRQEHEAVVLKLKADHEEALKRGAEEAAATLSQTEEDFYNALTKVRTEHAAAIEKQTADAATALERLRDEHARELRMADIAREGSLSESQSARDVALKELQEEQMAAISAKEKQFAEDIQKLRDEHLQAISVKDEQNKASRDRLKASHTEAINQREVGYADELAKLEAEHTQLLSTKDNEHRVELEKAAAEYATELAKAQEESSKEVARLTAELEQIRANFTSSSSETQKRLEAEMQAVKEQQASVLQEIEGGHAEELSRLEESHQAALTEVQREVEQQRSALIQSHTEEIAHLKAEHQTALAEAQANVIAAEEQHQQALEDAQIRTEQILSDEKARIEASIAELERQHAKELKAIRKEHDIQLGEMHEEVQNLQQKHVLLLDELESYKAASDEYVVSREETRRAHEEALQQKTDVIGLMHQQLTSSTEERDSLAAEVAKLRQELQDTRDKSTELVREASKRESLVDELERHRSVIAEMQEDLQRTKDEMDSLQAEKNKQDALLREMQSQLVRSPSPGQRQGLDRGIRTNGMSPTKLPPPAPPPTMPIPPAPTSAHEAQASIASVSSITSPISLNADTPLGSPPTPTTSLAPSSTNGPPSPTGVPDPKVTAQLQQQAKQIDEQEAMIKTLNKQLTHCEGDLQAHIDLVATLESSLGDSEKNLRKARMQATELARERDSLNTQIASLRAELNDARNEVVNVRRSIVEEKQSLEHRLDEERRAKERTRAQLEVRTEELQRRKSKFACL